MSDWIYFDYAATTPCAPEVLELIYHDVSSRWGFVNSGATYSLALENRRRLEDARAQLAAAIGADPREIVFTSGATESNNLALKGALTYHRTKNPHLITFQTEHKAVLDPAAILAKAGKRVTVLSVKNNGLLDLEQLKEALKTPTTLVSIMAVNNETGVIQPIADIAKIVHQAGAKLHVDAAQGLGKIPCKIMELGVDMMSFSGHKIYAPKGIGALYIRRLPKMRLQAQLQGGGQERGIRSGTSPLMLIRAFAQAATLAEQNRQQHFAYLSQLERHFWQQLSPSFQPNIPPDTPKVPHIINVSTPFPAGEVLAKAERAKIALSAGSACQAGSHEGSHVLRAMGLHDVANRSLRICFSHLTTTAEVDKLTSFLNQLT